MSAMVAAYLERVALACVVGASAFATAMYDGPAASPSMDGVGDAEGERAQGSAWARGVKAGAG